MDRRQLTDILTGVSEPDLLELLKTLKVYLLPPVNGATVAAAIINRGISLEDLVAALDRLNLGSVADDVEAMGLPAALMVQEPFQSTDAILLTSVLSQIPRSQLYQLAGQLRLNPDPMTPFAMAKQIIAQRFSKRDIYAVLALIHQPDAVEYLEGYRTLPTPVMFRFDTFEPKDIIALTKTLSEVGTVNLPPIVDQLLIHPIEMTPLNIAQAIVDAQITKHEFVQTLDHRRFVIIPDYLRPTQHTPAPTPTPITPSLSTGRIPLPNRIPLTSPYPTPAPIPTLRIPPNPNPSYI